MTGRFVLRTHVYCVMNVIYITKMNRFRLKRRRANLVTKPNYAIPIKLTRFYLEVENALWWNERVTVDADGQIQTSVRRT